MMFFLIILRLCVIFFQNTEEYVTFEQFGAKGNGADETAAISRAFSYAKEQELPLKLLGRTYRFSPLKNLDITGIPAITGEGTIDLSNTGPNAGLKSMTHVFTVKGSKVLMHSGVKVTKGKSQVQIPTQLDISPGNVLFFTSAESLPNKKRVYNCKGQRVKVSSYNRQTGSLSIVDTFFFDIAKAYVWKNDKIPEFRVGKGVRFVTSPMNFLGCFEIVYAKATISGTYENFALSAISLRSSEGRFEEVKTILPVTHNNGYSIGISVADMSEGFVANGNSFGGRHNISGTGGGIWRKSESGGPNEAAGYPSVLAIEGGTYKGIKNVNGISEDNGTLDSHGNVYKMTIRNCVVYGGINLGADYAFLENVTIHTDGKRAINFGSDVEPGSDWGHYKLSGCRIIVDPGNKKSVMLTKADVNVISLSRIRFDGIDENTLLADFRYPGPKTLTMEQLMWEEHDTMTKAPRFLVNRQSDITIDEVSCLKPEDIRKF